MGLSAASKRRPWLVIVGGTASFALAGLAAAPAASSAAIITRRMVRVLMGASSWLGAALAGIRQTCSRTMLRALVPRRQLDVVTGIRILSRREIARQVRQVRQRGRDGILRPFVDGPGRRERVGAG